MTTSAAVTAHSFATLMGIVIPVHIIDVGANAIDGAPPYAPMLRDGATLVGFEPNPAAHDRLMQMKRENEVYLPYAVGDGQTHTLHICAAEGMTSLLRPNSEVLKLFHGFPQWAQVIDTRSVETVRLDDVAEARGADMLKIDIQGGELMVMQHAEAILAGAVVIQSEVEFLKLYVDQPLFTDVEQFLRSRGFILHRFFPTVSRVMAPMLFDNNIFGEMSQLVWADAVFVRDFTRPDTFSDRQLLVAAAILHDLYKSFDLVLRLLVEHDRRNDTGHAAAYLSGLQALGQAQAA